MRHPRRLSRQNVKRFSEYCRSDGNFARRTLRRRRVRQVYNEFA